jgi:hypothetical protein
MKRISCYFVVACVCTSASLGAFDYTISETYEGGGVTLQSESLLVTGAGAYRIEARGSSYVEVQGTAPLQEFVGGIALILLDGVSSLDYYGGETGSLRIYDNAQGVLRGGRLDYLRSYQYVLSPNQNYIPHIEIVCKQHNFDSSTKRLTGVWMDDTTFNIQLVNQNGYDPAIENIFFTPEPATLLLVAAGGLLLRRKRR